MLLINGIIALIILAIVFGIYVWNLYDVWKYQEKSKERNKLTLQQLFSKNLPYVIVLPIGIAFIFVVVMPIIFTFLTSFLNYNRNHLPPGQLLDWVGLDNFKKKLFTVSIWSKTFFKVLGWTIVWTLFSYFRTLFSWIIPGVNFKA